MGLDSFPHDQDFDMEFTFGGSGKTWKLLWGFVSPHPPPLHPAKVWHDWLWRRPWRESLVLESKLEDSEAQPKRAGLSPGRAAGNLTWCVPFASSVMERRLAALSWVRPREAFPPCWNTCVAWEKFHTEVGVSSATHCLLTLARSFIPARASVSPLVRWLVAAKLRFCPQQSAVGVSVPAPGWRGLCR